MVLAGGTIEKYRKMRDCMKNYIAIFSADIMSFIIINFLGINSMSQDVNNISSLVYQLNKYGICTKNITNNEIRKSKGRILKNCNVLNANGTKILVFMGNKTEVTIFYQKQYEAQHNPLVDFIDTPHLYKTNKLVISYSGDDKKLQYVLEKILK